MNRALDIVGSTIGLALLSPLIVAIALGIKLEDRGRVLYRARRVGLGGQTLHVLKFRTMVPEADRIGAGITVSNDARVTAVGRFLRRFKLDELPQLVNVLIGQMSFVGPRPEDPRYVGLYTPSQRLLLSFTPGITSPASIRFKREEELLGGPEWHRTYMERVLPEKLRMELAYFPSRTFLSDLALIARTVREIAS